VSRGRATSVEYDDGQCDLGPDEIIGPFGHTLQLVYDPTTLLLDYLVDAGGAQIDFNYITMEPDFGGPPFVLLDHVIHQDGERESYLYQNTWLGIDTFLVGIVDEENIQYASFTYDQDGRATGTSHAGGYHAWTIAYNDDETAGAGATATDANQIERSFVFRTGNVGAGRITVGTERAGEGRAMD
jgi:hypothetical protein